MISTPPAASSCQNVTLPVIPELFDPNFLDVLLPHSQRPRDDHVAPPEATTSTSEPTFKRSPTFVAFKNIRPRTQPQDVWKILDKAWKEDPSLTLKLIWNSRSLVGNKRLLNSTFWQYVYIPSIVYVYPSNLIPLTVLTAGSTRSTPGRQFLAFPSFSNPLVVWRNPLVIPLMVTSRIFSTSSVWPL